MHGSLYLHWKRPDISTDDITTRLGTGSDIATAFAASYYANSPSLISSACYARILPEYVMILFGQGPQAFEVHVELRAAAANIGVLRQRIWQVHILLTEAIVHCGSAINEARVSILEADGRVISTGQRTSRMSVAWTTLRSTFLKDLIVGGATVASSWLLQSKGNFNVSALIGLSAAIVVMLTHIGEALYRFEPLRYETN